MYKRQSLFCFFDHFTESADLLLVDRLTDIESFYLIFVPFLADLDVDLHVPCILVGQPEDIELSLIHI